MSHDTTVVENMANPKKIKNRTTMGFCNVTSEKIKKKKELKALSQRGIYTHVRSNITHNSPKMEKPKCPHIDEWMNKK